MLGELFCRSDGRLVKLFIISTLLHKSLNNDMARCSDFKLYTLNILSSDYFSALKLYQKLENI